MSSIECIRPPHTLGGQDSTGAKDVGERLYPLICIRYPLRTITNTQAPRDKSDGG
jgi:hypothetical protein